MPILTPTFAPLLGGRVSLNSSRFGTLRGWYDFFDTACLFQESGTDSATTAVSSVADPIGRIINKVNSGNPYLYASSDSKRPTRRAFGSTFCARFDGTDDDLISSDTNYWKFMHTTTGFLALIVMQITDANPENQQVIYDANNGSSSGIGAYARYDDAGVTENRLRSFIANGTSATAANSDNVIIPQANTKLIICHSHSGGNGTIRHRVNGVETVSFTEAYTPSSSNPSFALKIGSTASSGTERLKADIAQVLIYETPDGYSQAALLESLAAPTA